MSREAFGDPPESQEPPDLCPVCGNDWHAEDCEFGKEVASRLKAERDAHRMQFALHARRALAKSWSPVGRAQRAGATLTLPAHQSPRLRRSGATETHRPQPPRHRSCTAAAR